MSTSRKVMLVRARGCGLEKGEAEEVRERRRSSASSAAGSWWGRLGARQGGGFEGRLPGQSRAAAGISAEREALESDFPRFRLWGPSLSSNTTQGPTTSNDMPSYDELHELYRDGHPCPPDFSFPTHVIDEWAKTDSELCAIHWVSADFSVERKVSYRQLADLSNRAAIVFGRQGIAKGDRVMVQLPRVCEWW